MIFPFERKECVGETGCLRAHLLTCGWLENPLSWRLVKSSMNRRLFIAVFDYQMASRRKTVGLLLITVQSKRPISGAIMGFHRVATFFGPESGNLNRANDDSPRRVPRNVLSVQSPITAEGPNRSNQKAAMLLLSKCQSCRD